MVTSDLWLDFTTQGRVLWLHTKAPPLQQQTPYTAIGIQVEAVLSLDTKSQLLACHFIPQE